MSEKKFEQRAMASADEGAARQLHLQPDAVLELRGALSDLPAAGTRPPPHTPIELSDDELPY
ncbi:hypothetical protein WI84_16415 [Burkholderia ubonensis]|uniref:hypothetical protein n=1 Tax=Burkholderia ubonensis TaxID=101571 RepID=UPI000757C9FA|nr:hypothetical protein [Burkholderia ubonensis]KVD35450.1 hypothetical protein WI84_16415 [Burkholderia ubonensis]